MSQIRRLHARFAITIAYLVLVAAVVVGFVWSNQQRDQIKDVTDDLVSTRIASCAAGIASLDGIQELALAGLRPVVVPARFADPEVQAHIDRQYQLTLEQNDRRRTLAARIHADETTLRESAYCADYDEPDTPIGETHDDLP